MVTGDYSLTREKIKEAQENDSLCERYQPYEKFWLDEDQERKGRVSTYRNSRTLVGTVLKCYHELPFTAN
jgi:hypothetical protein